MRRIAFSGYAWLVRDSGGKREGPGPNQFAGTPENVWLDEEGRLHLRVTRRGRAWRCAEVYSEQSFGYGRYVFYLDSRVDRLDANVVCGLFTYLDDAHEIDIEFARWGNPAAHNANYVLQPAALPGHVFTFPLALQDDRSTHAFIWQEKVLEMYSLHGHEPPPHMSSAPSCIQERRYAGEPGDVPAPAEEKVHLNLWLFKGRAPADGIEPEVIVNRVEIEPG